MRDECGFSHMKGTEYRLQAVKNRIAAQRR